MISESPKNFALRRAESAMPVNQSGLPEFSGILRQVKGISRIRCYLSRSGTSPTRASGQDD
eukprot:11703657-Karenia_brevis.AAC.1